MQYLSVGCNMPEMWETQIEGHRLATVSTDSGGDSGIPVIFLHGIGGSIYFWTPDLTLPFHDLGTGYSLSLPGHFPAAFPEGFDAECLTPQLIGRLLSGAIRQLVGDRQVILVGHSTGGFAALCTAIHVPELVQGIVCIAGFANGRWTGALGFNQWLVRQGSLGRLLFKKIYGAGGVNLIAFRTFWHAYAHDHTALLANPAFDAAVNSSFPWVRKLDVEAMAGYFTMMPQTDITSHLSKITAPTCVLVGDRDPIVPSRESYTIAARVPVSELAVIHGAGHLPFFEKPAAYERAVKAWISSV